jgi:HK97 family phage major capsid protein
MNQSVLDGLREQRDEARSGAIALAESDSFDPKDEVYLNLKTRAEALDARITEIAALVEARKNSDALDGRLSKTEKRQTASWQVNEAPLSFGEAFVRSEAFSEYASSPRGRMPKVEMDFQTRALPTGLGALDTAGLDLGKTTVNTQAPVAPTPLLDNINRVQVTSNAIDYVSWELIAGAAAVAAEGGNKHSVEFGPTVTSDSLDNIAAYTQLTRQLIEDAPSVRDMINGELVREILRAEEAAVATALGAATLTAVTGSAGAGDDLLSTIREGVGTVQAAGYFPNAVLLNPADWASLDNAVMGGTLAGPIVRQNFWGLTPIPSTAQTAGTAIVGDFRTGITQFYRSEVALYITDSHASTFLSNVFTLLAERRSLAAVIRPDALASVSVGV